MASNINLWWFEKMWVSGWIGNEEKLESLGREASDIINWKVVCDLWSWIAWFLKYVLDNWFKPSDSIEVDPVFESLWVFEKSKNETLASMRDALEFSKWENTARVFSVWDTPSPLMAGINWRSVWKLQDYIRWVEWKIAEIESSEFETQEWIQRYTDLTSKMKKVDTIFMTSVFYASLNPSMLLFWINKILSDDGQLIIIDHSDKRHIPRLLWAIPKIEGIELLSENKNELIGSLTSSVVVDKPGLLKLRSKFRI